MKASSFLIETAKKYPHHTAIVDNTSTLSYGELADIMIDASQVLHSYGVRSKMSVGVLGNNSKEFIIFSLAVMHLEAVLLPLDDRMKQTELEDLKHRTQLDAIIYTRSNKSAETIPITLQNNIHAYLQFNKVNAKILACFPIIKDAIFIRYTSGTTGISKGVVLSNKSIEERTRIANQSLELTPKDRVLWVLPMAYHFVVSILLYLRYGCAIIISTEFSSTQLLKEINDFNITFLYLSPMFIKMLASDTSDYNMPFVKRVISTSFGMDNLTGQSFFNRFGLPVTQAYGIIEIGLPIMNKNNCESIPESVGNAAPGFTVDILDDQGNLLPNDQIGNLAIYGPGMFDAYLNPFIQMEKVLINGYFFTGDLAVKTHNGLIIIKGRLKSMINVSGNKVFPEEVEARIIQFPDILQCRVKGVPHKLLGEVVSAEIVVKNKASTINIDELRRYCLKHLTSYKVPVYFEVVDMLQITGSGKIKR